MKIPISKPYLGSEEKTLVNECLESGWISSTGPFVTRFEEKFAQSVGASNALAVSNGTVALHLALVALGVGVGDEVLCLRLHGFLVSM